MCETYNVTSEGAIDCGNAADRQQLVAFCTASSEHAKLEMCKTVGANRAPSDDPHAGGWRAPSRPRRAVVGRTSYYRHKEFVPGSGVYWYNNR